MIRPSSRCRSRRLVPDSLAYIAAAVCVQLLGGCRPAGTGPEFPTASQLPSGPRHPDGVLVDPAPELPPSAEAGEASATLLSLTPPAPEKAARLVIRAFFQSIVGEDIERMSELLTPDATVPSKTRGGAVSLLEHWRGRMRHLKYRALAGEVVYHDAEVETYRYRDLDAAVPGRPQRPLEMDRADLLLRVPIASVRAGSDRLFGDEMLFLLRRDCDRYRIRALIVEFQLP
jgi:hypothetical protein